MRKIVFATVAGVLAFLSTTGLAAKDVDPRLATVRKAYVVAADEMSDEKPIAACLAEHLAKTTPWTVAETKDQADVLLIVTKGHLPGATARATFGGHGRVELKATLPDTTTLWTGVATFESADPSRGIDIPCYLADGIADKLRQAIRKAADRK